MLQATERSDWFVVMTHPGCERRVHLALTAASFRTFMPKVRRWVRHARQCKAVERPLLSRYLFVEADWHLQALSAITLMPGVTSVLSAFNGFEIAPLAIPRHFVEDFLHRQLSGEWDEVSKGPLPAGARVRIVEGKHDDALAVIASIKGGRAVVRLLETAGKPFQISAQHLRAA